MKLKAKLIYLIASICLVIAIISIGVLAASKATVTLGGTVSFTATDVFCEVTGSFQNVSGTAPVLSKLEFNASSQQPDQSTWANNPINFDNDATDIVLTITIKNKSNERDLIVKMVDNISEEDAVEDLGKDVKFDGQPYTFGEEHKIGINGEKTFTITFSYTNLDYGLDDAPYNYTITLLDESLRPNL